jgi:nicotinamidase-related amidase
MTDLKLVPRRTALLNVDLQNFFVESAPEGSAVLERINGLADACRRAGILVIHTAHVLRPDGSNTGVLGRLVPAVQDEGFLYAGARTAALHAELVVATEDITLEKPRFGAFHGTDLEMILRARGIDTVIITGISTDVCCDTTAREANARDFMVLFVSDGTAVNAENEEEAATSQTATLNVIDGIFGRVVTINDVMRLIAPPTGQDEPKVGEREDARRMTDSAAHP